MEQEYGMSVRDVTVKDLWFGKTSMPLRGHYGQVGTISGTAYSQVAAHVRYQRTVTS